MLLRFEISQSHKKYRTGHRMMSPQLHSYHCTIMETFLIRCSIVDWGLSNTWDQRDLSSIRSHAESRPASHATWVHVGVFSIEMQKAEPFKLPEGQNHG